MKAFLPSPANVRVRVGAAALAALLCLSSCDDKDKTDTPADKPAAQPAEQPAAQAAEPAPTATETQKALFDEAVYVLAAKVTAADRYPELNSEIKNLLELLSNHYDALCRENGDIQERARLSLLIAQTTRDLGAYPKAQAAFERALADRDALPDAAKETAEAKHALSTAYNGMGACLLVQGKTQEALTWYEKALLLDEERILALAPAEGEETEGDVPAELGRAAADALDSYRCMGDCQRVAGDPEEAAETYKKGQELVTRLKKLSPEMSIAYIKLLTATGNLSNSNGKTREAFAAWLLAAQICEKVNAASPRLDVKAETKRCHDALMPALQAVAAKLKEEQGEAPATEESPEGIQTEPIAPLPEINESAPAAETAAADAPAADAPAVEAPVADTAAAVAAAPAAVAAPVKQQPKPRQNNKRHKHR